MATHEAVAAEELQGIIQCATTLAETAVDLEEAVVAEEAEAEEEAEEVQGLIQCVTTLAEASNSCYFLYKFVCL